MSYHAFIILINMFCWVKIFRAGGIILRSSSVILADVNTAEIKKTVGNWLC